MESRGVEMRSLCMESKWLSQFSALAALACLALLFSGCAASLDSVVNETYQKPPYTVDERARKLHGELTIVDLHSDAMLWNRGILERADRGHVDIPRLLEGNVAIQVFAAVTSVPAKSGMTVNDDYWDTIGSLDWFQNRPQFNEDQFTNRAIDQATRLKEQIRANPKEMRLITTRQELEDLLKERAAGNKVIGAILALEGAHALHGKPENLDKLYKHGYRMLGLNHFVENRLAGGGDEGAHQYGLTKLGGELVRKAFEKGMIIDVAHSSDETIHDVVEIANSLKKPKPILVSHTGVRRTCDNNRNLGPAQVRGVQSTGGVVGVALFKKATCGRSVDHTARAMRSVIASTDINTVALGSDWDGFTAAAVGPSGLVLLTQALQKCYCKYEFEGEAPLGLKCLRPLENLEQEKRGNCCVRPKTSQQNQQAACGCEYQYLSDEDIKLIMGGNAIRVFKANLK
jgi:membrane dipeptidase